MISISERERERFTDFRGARERTAAVFRLKANRELEWLECAPLARLLWLVHGFSTRRGIAGTKSSDSFTLGRAHQAGGARIKRNRRRFFRAVGAGAFLPASLRQIHSASIYCVGRKSRGKELEYAPCGSDAPPASGGAGLAGDALLTDKPEVLLGVRVADCLPVLLADPRRRAIAAIHAGWRGALARIVEKTVGEMQRTFGSRPADLIAAIGPSIRGCCYEVGEEVVAAFCGRFVTGERFFRAAAPGDDETAIARRYPLLFLSQAPPGHGPSATAYFNLAAVARDQLERSGVKASRIYDSDICTACRTDLFFSYRKEGNSAGRMMAVIGIRPAM